MTIKVDVDTYRDTWLQLTFENKWFRNFPTEKFQLESVLQFYDSARRPGQKVILCEFAFAELDMTEGKLDFDDYDVDY